MKFPRFGSNRAAIDPVASRKGPGTSGNAHPVGQTARNDRVELMSRDTCGSCRRVEAQIRPICEEYGQRLRVVDVDADAGLRVEFGDRVPVILVDGEEIACWEIDDDELREALENPR